MPEWRLYGNMYYDENFKILVDQEFAIKNEEHSRKVKVAEATGGVKPKIPKWVTSWGIIARRLYAKVPDAVKEKVKEAVEAKMAEARALEEGPLLDKDSKTSLAKLEG